MKNEILDKNISASNYGKFNSCKIKYLGKAVEFTYANGIIYEAPLDYLLRWFDKPHLIYKNGRWIKYQSRDEEADFKAVQITNCRKVRNNSCIRIYLDKKIAFDVVWDTVLMACEERYEHFGGLTAKSKEITRKYFKKKQNCT